jgi:HlyD family secretion protein
MLFVDQGDMVKAGQVVAQMDTRDLAAILKQAGAMVLQAQQAVDEARNSLAQQQSLVLSTQAGMLQAQRALDRAIANMQQQQTQAALAKQELDRTAALVSKGNDAMVELLDQHR